MRWPGELRQFVRPKPLTHTEPERNRFAQWRQKLQALPPPRKQVLQSAAAQRPFRFTPTKRMRIWKRSVKGGGRNEGLTLGMFDALDGTPPIRVIEKRIGLMYAKHEDGHSYLPMSKAVVLHNDPADPYLFDVDVHVRRIMRRCNSTDACSHVATTVGNRFDSARGIMYVYIRYYGNGDLQKFMRRTHSTREKCRALWGAWTGLQQLHVNLNIIHNDLSPGNIFINDAGEGIIADLEDALVLPSEEPEEEKIRTCEARYAFHGTFCYGAPFAHCDVRRDQVALLMTTLEVLSGVSWQQSCTRMTPKYEFVDANGYSTYGFAASKDGREIDMNGAMYTTYATAINSQIARLSLTPGTDPGLVRILEAVLPILDLLAEIAWQAKLHDTWDYKEVHNKIVNALKTGL